jgi:hypothetical protein
MPHDVRTVIGGQGPFSECSCGWRKNTEDVSLPYEDLELLVAQLRQLASKHKRDAESIAPCPTCGGEVITIKPVVDERPTFPSVEFPLLMKYSDHVVGFELGPCGHQVKYVERHIHHGTKFPSEPTYPTP